MHFIKDFNAKAQRCKNAEKILEYCIKDFNAKAQRCKGAEKILESGFRSKQPSLRHDIFTLSLVVFTLRLYTLAPLC
ncbi:MAG: hypothetical protein JETT_3640 [Candidatus Jettenia ecosi]|uniref:Uncharacterized protein n=1 Tax=Candidatus Jettenia ecosi TaxID=2494326 RepID=A0A533Q6E2_9BACT|nr:MAG: hypothetical protein JETT_3640 [Candidatus Jettenia ecosi]